MAKVYFFISDIHLGLLAPEKEKEREKVLVRFLQQAKNEASELFILGDLFDYWFEYRRVVQKGYFKTFNALAELIDSGIKVHYIIGNHDFMHRDFFEKEIGAQINYNPLSVSLDDKKFYLAHGDGLVKNDTGYRILKKFLRNKFLQKLFSLIHPDLGIWLASTTSKKSREYTSNKHYGIIDGMFETAKEKIDEGYDYVMFGHSHERAFNVYKNGHYVNLGTWLDEPCYGKFSQNKFEIISWK